MAAAGIFMAVAVIAAFAVLAEGQTCPEATPNPCYNANGTSFVCCSGGCGPSAAVATCEGAEPVPDLSFYVFLDQSNPYASCINQPAAPGQSANFGDTCILNVPLYDALKQNVIGSGIYQLSTWKPYQPSTGNFFEVAPTVYFFGNQEDGRTNSLHVFGILLNSYAELSILGGSGKYRGARGYVISGGGECNDDGSICYYPKNVYLT